MIRTSEPAERLAPEEALRSYKALAQVERGFRCLREGFPLGERAFQETLALLAHRTQKPVAGIAIAQRGFAVRIIKT